MNGGRKKDGAGRRPREVADREMAQLPKILDHVGERLAHGLGEVMTSSPFTIALNSREVIE